jgi:superfamily II DNA or RNA helicase
MSCSPQPSRFYAEFDLSIFRREGQSRQPATHQTVALGKLSKWFENRQEQGCGGILVLPTGGGKTFTAVHFLCRLPLSQGFKVLWLAHTHHLLEQAYASFFDVVGLVAEPKTKLNIRVISGMKGEHFPTHAIRPTDDIIISSLPTACRAVKGDVVQMHDFLNSSQGNLVVVFDEAHHAPAPSHRQLLRELHGRYPGMVLLGLTATPTYGDERKQSWLTELFPQGIVHQVTAAELMAAGILAKPVLHEERTTFSPNFDEREYRKWLGTHRDIPEEIVDTLAKNQERNEYIVNVYVSQREKWGKTIIFADRWFQCDYLREALIKRGVRADVVYSHVDADPGSAEARNKRGADENARVLRAFKENQLDVLLNVKMLTEGTDIPNVQSVFLTRQTTSRILLTQMGRPGAAWPQVWRHEL